MKKELLKLLCVVISICILVCGFPCVTFAVETTGHVGDTIYFNNSVSGYPEVYIYLWNQGGEMAWPGEKMTPIGNDIWKYTLKSDFSHLIFSQGDSMGQTDDLNYAGNQMMATAKYSSNMSGVVWSDYNASSIHASSVDYATSDEYDYIITKEYEEEMFGEVYSFKDARLTRYYGNQKNLNIPETINYYTVTETGEKLYQYCTVTEIGDNLYQNCNCKEVFIHNRIASLGNSAFMNCEELDSVYFQGDSFMYDEIRTISPFAFYNCKNLKYIRLPDSLYEIQEYAFANCESLETIILPNTVYKISDKAFANCKNLKNVVVLNGGIDSGSNVFENCDNVTIYGNANSNVDSFAKKNQVSFVDFDTQPFVTDIRIYNATEIYDPSMENNLNNVGVEIKIDYAGGDNSEEVFSLEDGVFTGENGTEIPVIKSTIEKSPYNKFHHIITYYLDLGKYKAAKDYIQITVEEDEVYSGRPVKSASLQTLPSKVFDYDFDLNEIYSDESGKKYEEWWDHSEEWVSRNMDGASLLVEYENGDAETVYFKKDYLGGGQGSSGYYSFPNSHLMAVVDDESHFNATINLYSNENAETNSSFYVAGPISFTAKSINDNSKSINGCTINLSQSSYVFDGTEKKPSVTVKDGNKDLILNTDYSVSYKNNINVGSAVVTVTGKGNYGGTVSKDFVITAKSVSACTITVSPTSYAYDGTEKKPTVTVKDGNKALTLNTDYTVSYKNNINAGSAVVTVTGKGNYGGTVSKDFVITAKSVSGCTVTVSPTSYTYDGIEKKPTVTVKDGNKVLSLNVDFTVSYKNNVNVGNATVSVTGKGNYAGTATKNYSITQANEKFTWGKDNYNFLNSDPVYFPSSTYRQQIDNTYLNKLKMNLTNSEYQAIFEGTWYSRAWLDDFWGGSCYGMSSTTFLSKEGLFPYSSYQSGATKLQDLGYPRNNSNLLSLITYYQMLQVKDVIQQQYRTVPNKSNQENITKLISLLDKNSTVLVGFQKEGWGGHAILAIGYEYGSWTFNGISYQGCIKICDPNASTDYNTRFNIYFNTKSYNWTIPAYTNMTSTSGAKFNYIGATVSEINKGGYLTGASGNKIENYVARIDASAISNNRSVSKVQISNGYYVNKSSQPGEIVEDYSFVLGNESEGTVGYNLYDADASYKVSQSNAQELQLKIDYENCSLYGGSAAGKSVIFDKNGYVEVNGESATYNMAMTFDDTTPTDWFTIQVKGFNSDNASLGKVEGGYILTADNLENVSLRTNNRESHAQISFSTNYNSVYIYEINENTIGLKVDTDRNGTYETELLAESNTRDLGDVNNDGEVNVKDRIFFARYLANWNGYETINTTVADVNKDGLVDAKDRIVLVRHLAKWSGYDILPYNK